MASTILHISVKWYAMVQFTIPYPRRANLNVAHYGLITIENVQILSVPYIFINQCLNALEKSARVSSLPIFLANITKLNGVSAFARFFQQPYHKLW